MRASRLAVLPGAMILGVVAAGPALAGTPSRLPAAPATLLHRPAVAQAAVPGILCVDLDVAVILRLHVVLGACSTGGPPVAPPAPAPPAPAPVPPKPTPPRSPKPTRPAVPVPVPPRTGAAPAATVRSQTAGRAPVRTRPAVRRSPSPSSAAPVLRTHAPHTQALHRRRHPLSTVMVMVILTTVIAAGTGLAFAAR
jgi:hypothetical protein